MGIRVVARTDLKTEDNVVPVEIIYDEGIEKEAEVVFWHGDAVTAGELASQKFHSLSVAVIAVDSVNIVFNKNMAKVSESEQEMLEDIGFAIWFGWSKVKVLKTMEFICELLDRKRNCKAGTYMRLWTDLKARRIRIVFCLCY